ncbi:hypothetical protein TNCV_4466161 [Trichonephila clavipes]|nr:hypothetical protein TNCV_4466161 [Trichonephila clavipes]
MINGHTSLHVVANGTMTGQRYIDEVLLPHVRLFRGAVGDKFVFMDDNATCHRTLAVQDCLGSEVAGRNYPPTNKNTLLRALTEEWDKLPQQLLDNVVQTRTPQTFGDSCPLDEEYLMEFKTFYDNKEVDCEVQVLTTDLIRDGWKFTISTEQKFLTHNPNMSVL